jgi:hypothetical protein
MPAATPRDGASARMRPSAPDPASRDGKDAFHRVPIFPGEVRNAWNASLESGHSGPDKPKGWQNVAGQDDEYERMIAPLTRPGAW